MDENPASAEPAGLPWRTEQVSDAGEFTRRMSTTDWPGSLPDLEVALLRFAHLVNEAAHTFSDRADERSEGDLHVYRRYKSRFNPNFQRDREEFNEWLAYYEGMIFEATKAANWIRTEWRSANNSDFLAGERVHIITGPHSDLRHQVHTLEYTEQERDALRTAGPDGLGMVPVKKLEFGHPPDGLDRLVREIMENVLETEIADDIVGEVAWRIRNLEEPTDTADLFEDLPGRRPDVAKLKRVTHDLYEHGVLVRNPVGRGFVRGEMPPP